MFRIILSLIYLLFPMVLGCGSDNVAMCDRAGEQFVPDNDLWKEDNLNFVNNVDEDLFNQIIDIAEDLYNPIAEEWDERLTISRLYSNPTVNASAWRDGKGRTEIRMYGGLARRPEVIPQGFALVLCHELGHLYGGQPYINWLKMAAEGQSDYYGAGWCLKNILDRLNYGNIESTSYMQKVCGSDDICLEQLAGGQSLGNLLATLSNEKSPDFETPDTSVVKKTNTSYPKTIQCRLDSYHNGTLGKERPLCWYKP